MNRDYILRDGITWLTQIDQLEAAARADAEGFGDVFRRLLDDAGCHDLDTVDICALPEWAQDKLREWYGMPP